MIDFLTEHIGAGLAVLISSFATWFFSRQSSELDNVDKSLKIYREMVDDLGGQLKYAIEQLNEAKRVIKELEATIEKLTDELTKYKQLNGKVGSTDRQNNKNNDSNRPT